jgi:hypothetical protein
MQPFGFDGSVSFDLQGPERENLGLSDEELFADPLAFVDRDGQYWAPWPTSLRLTQRIYELMPQTIARHIDEEEADWQAAATGGYHSRFSETSIPATIGSQRKVSDIVAA